MFPLLTGSCGGSPRHPATPASYNNPSFNTITFSELCESLQAEFDRLGIDPAKVAAKAPTLTENRVFDLAATVVDADGAGPELPTGISLTWTEQLVGDYDQNALVNINDLQPLGAYWHLPVAYDDPGLHDGFAAFPTGDPDGTGAENWRRARIDGDHNSEINYSDVTPIAQHWNERLDGYVIERAINYGTGELVWEEAPVDLGGGSWPSCPRVDYSEYDGATPVRYDAVLELDHPEYATYLRVRPYDSTTETSGEASNVVTYVPDATRDTTPPYWEGAVGVASLNPYAGQITVEFGTAIDDETPPVSYTVYWAEGDEGQPDAPFDYEAANKAVVTGAPHTITGLTDGQYYRVAVRARDSANPVNEEMNTEMLGTTVGPRDIYPPVWQGRTGIADLIYGSNQAYVAFDCAVDSHTDEYGTWESGPVTYRVYYGTGDTPDFDTAEYEDFDDIGLDAYVAPIEGLDTMVTRWFAVRVLDKAGLSNEDGNTEYKVGNGVAVKVLPMPGAGPGVPETAEADPECSKFVFNRDRSKMYFLYPSYDPPAEEGPDRLDVDTWLSIWSCDDDLEFTHISDELVLPHGDIDGYHDARILEDGDLQLLYSTDITMMSDTLVSNKLMSDDVETYAPGSNYFVEFAHFNTVDTPIVLYTELVGSIPNIYWNYHVGTLPDLNLTTVWISDEPNCDLLFYDDSIAISSNGSISFPINFKDLRPDNPFAIFSTNGNVYNIVEWNNFGSNSNRLLGIHGYNTETYIKEELIDDEKLLISDEITSNLECSYPILSTSVYVKDLLNINNYLSRYHITLYNNINDTGKLSDIYTYELILNQNIFHFIYKSGDTRYYNIFSKTKNIICNSQAWLIGKDQSLVEDNESIIVFYPTN